MFHQVFICKSPQGVDDSLMVPEGLTIGLEENNVNPNITQIIPKQENISSEETKMGLIQPEEIKMAIDEGRTENVTVINNLITMKTDTDIKLDLETQNSFNVIPSYDNTISPVSQGGQTFLQAVPAPVIDPLQTIITSSSRQMIVQQPQPAVINSFGSPCDFQTAPGGNLMLQPQPMLLNMNGNAVQLVPLQTGVGNVSLIQHPAQNIPNLTMKNEAITSVNCVAEKGTSVTEIKSEDIDDVEIKTEEEPMDLYSEPGESEDTVKVQNGPEKHREDNANNFDIQLKIQRPETEPNEIVDLRLTKACGVPRVYKNQSKKESQKLIEVTRTNNHVDERSAMYNIKKCNISVNNSNFGFKKEGSIQDRKETNYSSIDKKFTDDDMGSESNWEEEYLGKLLNSKDNSMSKKETCFSAKDVQNMTLEHQSMQKNSEPLSHSRLEKESISKKTSRNINANKKKCATLPTSFFELSQVIPDKDLRSDTLGHSTSTIHSKNTDITKAHQILQSHFLNGKSTMNVDNIVGKIISSTSGDFLKKFVPSPNTTITLTKIDNLPSSIKSVIGDSKNFLFQSQSCDSQDKSNSTASTEGTQKNVLILKVKKLHSSSKAIKESGGLQSSLTHIKPPVSHGAIIHKCNFCDKRFPSKSKKESHEISHTNSRPFKCFKLDCDKYYNSKASRLKHYKKMHLNNRKENSPNSDEALPEDSCINYCKKCNKYFETSNQYNHHLRYSVSHGQKLGLIYKCNICDKQFTCGERLEYHENSHTNARPYKCSDCDKCFNSKSARQTHHRLRHLNIKKPRFLCCFCGYTTESREHVLAHEAAHQLPEGAEIPKPFKCVLCGKRYMSQWKLKCHQGEHRLKKCDKCSEKFKSVLKLSDHKEAVHNIPAKTFTCEKCGKQFRHVKRFQIHKRRHSLPLSLFCDICEKGFKSKNNLIQHMVTHCNERPFCCPECGERYKRIAGLRLHVAACHGSGRN